MQTVSEEFKQAVYAPARRTDARVTFDISDVSAHEDATAQVTSEAEISRKDQLHNLKRTRPAYATFEPDYWKLDGSFCLPPKPNEPDFEVGWYSDTFSDDNGEFNPAQVMEFTFTEPHSSIGLTIHFDVPAEEYATDFDIDVYDASDNLIENIQIRDNDKTICVIDEGLADYQRIVITLLKWSHPQRRAKVIEVSFGVVRTYTGDNLIKLNLIEEINTTSATVPSNELKFTVDNSNREFNILNPEGSYRYLQERQIATVEIGIETSPESFEFVPMGIFFLSDWQSDEGGLTTTFTARNRIDIIPDIEIENLTNQSTNLYDLAVSILDEAGIKKYTVDNALQSINTQGIYKKMKYRTLLQMIAIAGQCVMYVDREDTLHIKRLSDGASVDTIDFDNIYSEPKINLDKLVSRVEVNYYAGDTVAGTHVLTGDADGGVTLKVDNTLINSAGQAQDVAEWIMSESNKRALWDTNWRQNPALETGDLVDIEDVYGGQAQSRIIRQEYTFAGYLSGKTKSKGAI